MSCIVGLEFEGGVVLGGDHGAVADTDLTRIEQSKVFRLGEMIIGFVESFRMGQVVRYSLKPTRQRCVDDVEHLATVFVEQLRSLYGEAGVLSDTGEAPGALLIGYRHRLYSIDTDFHVARSLTGYEAIGSGAPFALGSLASTFSAPESRARLALIASARHCTTVAAPFTILTSS
jgi:hypothetical protein